MLIVPPFDLWFVNQSRDQTVQGWDQKGFPEAARDTIGGIGGGGGG